MSKESIYDFVVNDEDEVMLLIYASDTPPQNPQIILDYDAATAELVRHEDDVILLKDIPVDIFDSLGDADKLLVCELAETEEEEQDRIVYVYEADILD